MPLFGGRVRLPCGSRARGLAAVSACLCVVCCTRSKCARTVSRAVSRARTAPLQAYHLTAHGFYAHARRNGTEVAPRGPHAAHACRALARSLSLSSPCAASARACARTRTPGCEIARAPGEEGGGRRGGGRREKGKAPLPPPLLPPSFPSPFPLLPPPSPSFPLFPPLSPSFPLFPLSPFTRIVRQLSLQRCAFLSMGGIIFR